jgi:hypothetical protein
MSKYNKISNAFIKYLLYFRLDERKIIWAKWGGRRFESGCLLLNFQVFQQNWNNIISAQAEKGARVLVANYTDQVIDSKKWKTSNSKLPGPINLSRACVGMCNDVCQPQHLVQKCGPKVISRSKGWKILPFFIQNVLWRSVFGVRGEEKLTVPQFRASPPEHFTICTEWSLAQNNYAKGNLQN